jgi:hypothetical protein
VIGPVADRTVPLIAPVVAVKRATADGGAVGRGAAIVIRIRSAVVADDLPRCPTRRMVVDPAAPGMPSSDRDEATNLSPCGSDPPAHFQAIAPGGREILAKYGCPTVPAGRFSTSGAA